jgi:hypothetical protein
MLDPVSAIAFEMQASKGVFALLLGSGVSFAAKIPTGWDITLNLVEQVATLRGESCGADRAAWYFNTFGKQADYSEVLDQLATTPALRQEIIKKYIEPTEDEQTRGHKQPTAAHHAIARLMASGHIRVVLTTNFDRLLEQALAELGVHPIVISSADQVAGAPPLVHAGPMIVKLHGDYLDSRIRNTAGELATYEPPIEQLLDRVLDEFGLIVCGWSAEWDVALKAAIDRAPSRRYPMYWTSYGETRTAAAALVNRRKGRVVQINGADGFFDDLAQKVHLIEDMRRPHPASSEIAVAMLKEYLPEQRHQIRLHDLVAGEVDRVIRQLDGPGFSIEMWSPQAFADQAMRYVSALSTLLPMAYAAGVWSTPEQTHQWVDAAKTFGSRMRGVAGSTPLINLRAFPATLLIYAFCLGALVGRRPSFIGMMMGEVMDFGNNNGGRMTLGDRLNVAVVIEDGGQDRFKSIPAYVNARLPGSAMLAAVLQPLSTRDLRDDPSFASAFAKLELTISFGWLERQADDGQWTPPGLYAFKSNLSSSILAGWREDYAKNGMQAALPIMAGLSTAPKFDQMNNLLKRFGSIM